MGHAHSGGRSKAAYRVESFANDATAFRVFVKKRNKFIPGWLKINEDEIVFIRNGSAPQFWPLAYLRRYGYTCAGIFFFESGRRCASGEGLHTFQSHQSERIFQVVQSKIRTEELRASRASSGLSSRLNAAANTLTRIHPVQRFSSEGAGTHIHEGRASNNFLLNRNSSNSSGPIRRPAPPVANGVLHSSSTTNVNLVRERDRPRSVVSALEYDVGRLNKAPPTNLMNASYTSNADSVWSQVMDGEIVNEQFLNGHQPSPQPPHSFQHFPLQRPEVFVPPLSQQRKYHSYVNIDFPEARSSYRESSAASDIGGHLPALKLHPRINSLMSQSQCSPLVPNGSTAFEPAGDFPSIDRGRGAVGGKNAAPARPIAIPQRPPPGMLDYIQVPMAHRPPLTPPAESTALPKNRIRVTPLGARSDCSSVASTGGLSAHSAPAARSRAVNYAMIDFNKTKALEQFASGKQKTKPNGVTPTS
ncbi:IRS-type PTB domain-containing protein [Aphelenchoides fujianensis]|nr:IRS-type PTB domain-containing protein [Aphelenchoides fujianensis]